MTRRTDRRWIRRCALGFGKAIAFVLVVLILSEISLRWLTHRRERNKPTMASLRTSTIVMHRLWGQWLGPKPDHPFQPPFTVFSNRGWDDQERLKAVYERSKLPPNRSWKVADFLQPPGKARQHLFTVTTNDHGFRDPPRPKNKPAGTFRIICLGAYQTFGQGVDDERAFPRQLEGYLNLSRPEGFRYEVWNGGRPSATAIEGLARMQFEVFDYKPDLLILDYGFVDAVTLDDNLMPVSLRLPSRSALLRMIRRLLDGVLSSPLARSYVVNQVLQRVMHLHRQESLGLWEEVMRRMIGLARGRGIPVIVLDQGWVLASSEPFERLASGIQGVQFVSVRRVFQQFPPTREQIEAFHSGYNWSQEFEPFFEPLRKEYVYQVDIFHPNRWGHELIARVLAERVRRMRKRINGAVGM